MGKPRLIILVRHAQSEGNKNRDIHQTTPDHRVKLTTDGWKQAEAAGIRLRSLLSPTDRLHFFTSPYRRTRETTEGILNTLTSDSHSTQSPSPFPRHSVKVYEEPRLREQDFGNFQPGSEQMKQMWHDRASYGHFFYRIPNGESAADAYDRISGFNESLWRYFSEEDFASVCILVTHGLMSRVFLMKWYHFSVEYFEDLRNVDHCEFIILKLDEATGKYRLLNDLRTWSQLKREREAGVHSPGDKEPDSPVPVRKQWHGCSGWEEKAGLMGDDFARRQARRRHTEREDDPIEENTGFENEWQESDDQAHPSRGGTSFAYNTLPPQPKTQLGSRHAHKTSISDYNSTGRDGGGSRSGAASPALASSEEEGMSSAAVGANVKKAHKLLGLSPPPRRERRSEDGPSAPSQVDDELAAKARRVLGRELKAGERDRAPDEETAEKAREILGLSTSPSLKGRNRGRRGTGDKMRGLGEGKGEGEKQQLYADALGDMGLIDEHTVERMKSKEMNVDGNVR